MNKDFHHLKMRNMLLFKNEVIHEKSNQLLYIQYELNINKRKDKIIF